MKINRYNQSYKTTSFGKAKGIMLLIVFLFHLVGFYISFQGLIYKAKHEIKQTIKSGIPKEEILVFNANTLKSSSTFRWEEKGKEFWFEGKIYDVLKQEENGTIHCINDKKEKEIHQKLNQLISNYFSTDNQGKKQLNNLLIAFSFDYLPADTIYFPHSIYMEELEYIESKPIEHNSVLLEVNSPPPKHFIA